MEQIGLIQAMSVLQNYIILNTDKESDVKKAWDCVRDNVTQMLGTMMTVRQIFEADGTVDDVAEEIERSV